MKGIVLAGGHGTRLHPATMAISKQLLPIYDKPMIYYPLSVLMLAGIREILLISQSEFLPLYKKLLGNGERFGINLEYRSQEKPRGIAEAFLIGEDFIGKDRVSLVLGDNIFYGQGFSPILKRALVEKDAATIFAYRVNDPQNFGVITLDECGSPISLDEKPSTPQSPFAVTGLYFYPNDVVQVAKEIRPSARGELEITSINQTYLTNNRLAVEILGRGFAWLDTGLPGSLLSAAHFIETVQSRQGILVACLEEIAFQNGWINDDLLDAAYLSQKNSSYGEYIRTISRGALGGSDQKVLG